MAVTEEEVARLRAIYSNGLQNGVEGLQFLEGTKAIQQIEPNCGGLAAINSPNTGIVDFRQVATSFGAELARLGGTILLDFEATGISQEGGDLQKITSSKGQTIRTRYLVTCGGLHADRLAALAGGKPHPPIVSFRGEFLRMKAPHRGLVRGLIYPVPDPRFPFLGVHFTKRIDGNMDIGPNAVLAFAREGYRYTDVNLRDLAEFVAFRGMRALLLKHWSFALKEFYRSVVPGAQLRFLQQYVPAVQASMLETGPSGVRAQAMRDDGSLVEDFVFEAPTPNTLHVRNAPSPAATSSIAIGREVASRAGAQFFK